MMNRMLDSAPRSPFSGPMDISGKARTIPLLASSIPPSDPSPGDPMDLTPPTSASMAPPVHSSPEIDQGTMNNTNGTGGESALSQSQAPNQPIGAAAAAQQPKVVQTA